jgi:hypothetical protein
MTVLPSLYSELLVAVTMNKLVRSPSLRLSVQRDGRNEYTTVLIKTLAEITERSCMDRPLPQLPWSVSLPPAAYFLILSSNWGHAVA